jgi:hypothetical protein
MPNKISIYKGAQHLLFLFFILISTNSFCQSQKEQQFRKAVKEIAQKISISDSVGLSKYIQPGVGVYLVYRMGASNSFKKFKTISFNDSSYPNLLFFHTEIKVGKIRYTSLPAYNCDDNTWSKKGAFTDTTKTDRLLSNTAKQLKRGGEASVSDKLILNFRLLESKSRRIVLTSDEGNDFIFYLRYVNKKWFLLIVDSVTTDCSV